MDILHKLRFSGAIITFSLLLAACDGNEPFKDLSDYIAGLKGKDTPAQSEEKVSPVTAPAPSSIQYQSKALRSPFEVREITNVKSSVAANPLQAYPLDMLRFVGTVTQNGDTVAFITAPDSRIYQIKVGDVIGDRQGKVVTIDADRISLIEQSAEDGPAGMKRVVTLKLKETSQ